MINLFKVIRGKDLFEAYESALMKTYGDEPHRDKMRHLYDYMESNEVEDITIDNFITYLFNNDI